MQPRAQGSPAHDPAWERVRKNRVLRGEAKLAWQLLWSLLGRRPGTLTTSPVDVGADQGGDKRAGLRALNALELAGLIEVSLKRNGAWVVYVVEPAELERARRRPYDPQLELDDPGGGAGVELKPAEGGADVVQHPPPKSSESSENARFESSCSSKSSDLRNLVSSESSESSTPRNLRSERNEGARQSMELQSIELRPLGAVALAQAAAAAEREPGDWPREAEVERIARKIFQTVRDARLRKAPVYRVAGWIADRQCGEGELDDALREVRRVADAGQITADGPYALFIWHMKRLAKRRGLFWPEPKN